MKFETKEIQNKETWEKFFSNCEEKTFLNSWNWGEFNKLSGNKIFRLGIFDIENNKQQGAALAIKIKAKRGVFLFLPHAPSVALAEEDEPTLKRKLLETLLNKLKIIAKEEKVDFIRIAPILGKTEENAKIFKNLGFRDAPIHMHAELTWELNLQSTEEELQKKMRKTTRYLIRKAQQDKSIEIIKAQNSESVDVFNKIYQETVNRRHFVPFSLNYLKNEFLSFSPDNQILVFFGKYKGDIIAAAIIVFWLGGAFYHHAASSLKYPKIPVSYLLQWEAIKEAQKRGCKIYNFWGISRDDNPSHPWTGLSLFKKGFGGYEKEYVKTQDLPLSMKYWITYVFEKLRKRKRGL